MNRRSFFNRFGAAILGTAIALKIPDSLIPSANIPEPFKVPIPTFAQLNELYERLKEQGGEPKYLILSVDMLNAIDEERFSPYCVKLPEPVLFSKGYRFRNADMLGSPFYKDERIFCGNGTGRGKILDLLKDEII